MLTTLYFVRNAATIWSDERRLMGRRDQGLSERGRAQAELLAERFASIEVTDLVCSPLLRAVDTANAIAKKRGIGVTRDVRLIDVELGSWEGRSFAEVEATPEYAVFREQPMVRLAPDVECLADVRERVVASIEQLLSDSEVGAKLVVVTHSVPIRLALAHYLGMNQSEFYRLRVSPGAISVMQFDATRPRLIALNHTEKLSEIYDSDDLA